MTAKQLPPQTSGSGLDGGQEDKLPILDRLEQEGLCTVLRILPYIPEDRPFNAYEHGEILYKDSDHMSSKGSIKLFQHLKPQLKEALKKESTASSGLQKP